MHALVIGATGASGKEIVKLLLANAYFSKVSIFVRGNIDLDHKKLTVHKIDFFRRHLNVIIDVRIGVGI